MYIRAPTNERRFTYEKKTRSLVLEPRVCIRSDISSDEQLLVETRGYILHDFVAVSKQTAT